MIYLRYKAGYISGRREGNKMKKSRVMALVLATALCLGCMAGYTKPAKADSENLIVNGNFDDPDNLEVWNEHQSGATITAETSDTPIGDTKIKTYGKITNRTSNYQSFAQDVLGKIEKVRFMNTPFILCWTRRIIRMLRQR